MRGPFSRNFQKQKGTFFLTGKGEICKIKGNLLEKSKESFPMKTPVWKRAATLLCALTMALGLNPLPALAREDVPAASDRTGSVQVSLFDEGERSYLPAQTLQVIRILMEGEELTGSVPAFLREGRTLFPLRLVSEALGATVDWIGETRQAVVTWEDRHLVFTLGSPVALADGEEQLLPDGVGPCLASSAGEERTMVPLRFLAEWLGLQVRWENATRTVYLTTGEESRPGEPEMPEEPEPPGEDELPVIPGYPEEPERPAQTLEGFYVAVDAGHGGYSTGALYEGIQEKDINLPIALRVAELLEERGCRVLLTREDDRFVDLYDRSYMANDAGVDIFVSIHANASETDGDFQGIFTYHCPGAQRAKELAQTVQDEVVQATGAMDWGLLAERFVVLKATYMPAILVETGFMSCHEELMRLIDPEYQEKLAQGIARGIEAYLTAGQD